MVRPCPAALSGECWDSYLGVEQGQSFSGVHGDEHLHQELLVLCLQRQRKPVDDAADRSRSELDAMTGGQQQHPGEETRRTGRCSVGEEQSVGFEP